MMEDGVPLTIGKGLAIRADFDFHALSDGQGVPPNEPAEY